MLRVRPAAVAGSFYPGSPPTLAATVKRLLDGAPQINGRCPKALIVPHAGYIYSGPIAASAYAQLRPWVEQIERVVVIGPAHRVAVRGVVAAGVEAFATPLGELAVEATTQLPSDPRAHAEEHSLEVQLPFLATLVPHAKIIPLVVGAAGPQDVGRALETLYGGDETLIVVSSDLSHYLPYDLGRARDQRTVQRVLGMAEDLVGEEACGAAALNGLAWLAKRHALEIELLDLRSSGDTAGGRSEVVGYAAFALYEGRTDARPS